MQSMSAKDAKYGFGRLIDLARSKPVTVEKHGRPVVVVMAVEEYERLAGKAEKQRSEPAAPKFRGGESVTKMNGRMAPKKRKGA